MTDEAGMGSTAGHLARTRPPRSNLADSAIRPSALPPLEWQFNKRVFPQYLALDDGHQALSIER